MIQISKVINLKQIKKYTLLYHSVCTFTVKLDLIAQSAVFDESIESLGYQIHYFIWNVCFVKCTREIKPEVAYSAMRTRSSL